MSRSTQNLTTDQIVAEISELREAINVSAQRVYELSKTLYTQTRRTASSNTTTAYIAYSNAWMRFSGALTQGLRRTASTDRLLERAQQESVRADLEIAKKVAAVERKQVIAVRSEARKAVFGDLIELYGEEMVRDASR